MVRNHALALSFVLTLTTAACVNGGAAADDPSALTEDPDGGGGGGGGGSDPPFQQPDGACEGPLGFPTNPASLPKCCEAFPGKAHCFPMAKVPAELQTVVAKCEDGAACVPDIFISTGGVHKPRECKSLGGPGVCLSRCIPMVEEKAALLPWDVCDEESERCVPCINPLDKKETGACKIQGVCKGEDAGTVTPPPPVDAGPPKCPHEGPPVIDPTKLPACQCGDSHCVPKTLIPGELSSKVSDCAADGTGKCVPDSIIATGGNFIPKTCKSVAGAEGRCLSACLPDVAAQAAMLPQDICGAAEKCVPCFNPLDGTETGSCKLSCDPGPKEPFKPLPKCCSERGTCVPTAAAGAAAKSLEQDKCPTEEFVCAPDVFVKKTWKRVDCEAKTLLLGSAGPGVCMPECIKGMSFLLQRSSCAAGEKCAPCKDPITKKPTGACEFSL